ncbi:hypothetical protein RHS02_06285, partial [Rhizoctonia solani]
MLRRHLDYHQSAMGCIPSRSSMDVEPKPNMRIVARTMTRGSSLEHFPNERPYSPTSVETKVPNDAASPTVGVPKPPRVDCIARRPSNESFKRRKAEQGQAHQEGTTTSTVTASTAIGAAVTADDGTGAGGSGGGDAGSE